MAKFYSSYTEEDGTEIPLEGESVEEVQAQLPEDYDGPRREVRDEPGFVRGWIGPGGYTAR